MSLVKATLRLWFSLHLLSLLSPALVISNRSTPCLNTHTTLKAMQHSQAWLDFLEEAAHPLQAATPVSHQSD